MDMFVFENYWEQLLWLWAKNISMYKFESHIISLAITWIIILTNYEEGKDSDSIPKIAEKWLMNKTDKFVECWLWIMEIYTKESKMKLKWLESPKYADWDTLLLDSLPDSEDIFTWSSEISSPVKFTKPAPIKTKIFPTINEEEK